MDDVVVDASVVIKWFVAEPHSAEARKLLTDHQAGTLNFLVPDLLYAEVGKIVWKKHRLQGMAAADAQQIIDAFRKVRFVATA
jgi:predicted nucleic acid-binding protein